MTKTLDAQNFNHKQCDSVKKGCKNINRSRRSFGNLYGEEMAKNRDLIGYRFIEVMIEPTPKN